MFRAILKAFIIIGVFVLPDSARAGSIPQVGLSAVSVDPDIGAVAIVELNGSQKQELRALGDELTAGFYIAEISGDAIKISNGSQTFAVRVGENLRFTNDAAKLAASDERMMQAAAQKAIDRWQVLRGLMSGLVSSRRLRLPSGPDAGGIYISFTPHGILKSIGLLQSDIIVRINGRLPSALTNDDINKLFLNTSRFNFSVRRKGQLLDLSYEPL